VHIESEMENGLVICHIDGRIDTNTAGDFESTISALLNDGQRRMVLNMRDVYYVSSAGLRAVLIIAKQAQAATCSLRIPGLSEAVQKAFEVTGFHTAVPVFDDVTAALDAAD